MRSTQLDEVVEEIEYDHKRWLLEEQKVRKQHLRSIRRVVIVAIAALAGYGCWIAYHVARLVVSR